MSASTALAGVVAVLVSAAIGALAFGLWINVADVLALGLLWILLATPVALAHCVFIAAPLYAVLIERWPLRWWNAGLVGFGIGAIPIPFWVATTGANPFDLLMTTLWFGVSGLAGGLAFRAVRGPGPAGGPAE
ncbi:hypothetical protein HZY97_20425 [Sphingomonas sp. R-74633]|uniref:hypothetical protein n=1 Tax=Sphingomonas sp. R-74633 TaxID=2751188 RepID=UPI0015D41791|nr:hypothetical protein [Sphingomonas sp. R-74633]NYT43152.1 hypothetical protein [Sphingomonas sp. R-74633]